MMKTNKVKKKLRRGEVSLGTLVFEFDTPGLPRLCELAGAEFVIFDQEHTRFTIERIAEMMAWCRNCDLVPLVRPPATAYHLMSRPMDAGAMGLMVPMVESADQAQQIVDAIKYGPLGKRGTAFGVAHDNYRSDDIVKTMASSNRESMILAQIESQAGVENVDEILSVKGIDVAWVGHFDLTQNMGIPADFKHRRFQKAMDQVAEAAERRGAFAGRMMGSAEEAVHWAGRGFRMLAYGLDIQIYQEGLRAGLEAVRKGLGRRG
jgi:2-dehydro-3-deoxyglucarate aldolase/4-hydroxy-2-oxoheptanedioate aldolase